MALVKIFLQVNLRHATQEWGKFLLSVFGVAVGVAVFLAIRLSNYSAFKSFEATIDNVNGKANAQIQSRSGVLFSQSVFKQVLELKERLPALKAATPVTEQISRIKGTDETLIILGIDIFSDRHFRTYEDLDGADSETFLRFLLEPNTIIISQRFAERYQLKKGQTVELFADGLMKQVKIIGIFKTDRPTNEVANSFAVMDIEQAQRAFGKEGKLNKIDLILDDSQSQVLKKYLSEVLPEDVEVVSAKNRGEQVAKMLSAFEMNLAALAFISLLVAMFLIYNTITTNAIRRRREIGILRALGLGALEVFSLFILEALLIGVLGSALGVGLGILLAHYTLQSVASTITALYIFVAVKEVQIDWAVCASAFGIGVVASVVSALYPALEVYRVHPREAFHVQAFEQKFSLNLRRIVISSVTLLILGVLLAQLPSLDGKPIFGYASAVCAILGFALLSPEVVVLLRRLFERAAKRLFGIEGKLAANNLAESLNRTATAISALMVAVAMLIGISVMVGSFRQTVAYWIDQTLRADVFIAPAERFAVGSNVPIAREVLDYVRALPETKAVDEFSARPITLDGKPTVLCAPNFETVRNCTQLLFRKGNSHDILSEVVANEQTVVVTEVFANKFGYREGDSLTLVSPTGTRKYRIAGVYYDYASDRGLIAMHRAHFEKFWQDNKLNNIGVYLHDKSQAERIVEQIRKTFADRAPILVYSNLGLRRRVLDVFDQTFAITYVLQFVAMAVAAMGVISSLMAIILERRREIGILRSVGASAEQVRNITLIEAALMGVMASVLGIVCGMVLALILIYVINLQSFGWTIQVHLPIGAILSAVLLVVATALVSGWIPARYAMRLAVAEQVRFE